MIKKLKIAESLMAVERERERESYTLFNIKGICNKEYKKIIKHRETNYRLCGFLRYKHKY